MNRLAHAEELLDGSLEDEAVLAGNLRDLRRINAALDGVRLSSRALDVLLARAPRSATDSGGQGSTARTLVLADIGTGGGDIPIALRRQEQRHGVRLKVIGFDNRPEVLRAALALEPDLAADDHIELRLGDGRRLPLADRSVDVAHASLVLHHLEPDEATAFLGEMARIARLGVIVNDLTRSWFGFAGAWLIGHVLTRNRFTRHDAPLSVRRAYRPAELRALLAAAGLRSIGELQGSFGQRYAFVAVRNSSPLHEAVGR